METFKLPASNFEWVDEKTVKSWSKKDILNLPTQADIGYAFEVDLVYPKKYHRVRVIQIRMKGNKENNFFPSYFREMISSHWLRTTAC